MTAKFLKQVQELKKSIEPTTQEERANQYIRNESAYADVVATFPNMDEHHHAVLTKVVKEVFDRAKDGADGKGAGYTPFKSTPEMSVTHPQSVIDYFQSQDAEMLPIEGNKSKRVTVNSMSMLTGISKGTFASINAGQQHMTMHALEKWRKALAAIGSHNEQIPDVYGFSKYGDPRNFFYNLLAEWRDLESTLPLSRIREWATEYSGLSSDDVEKEIEEHRPTHREFLRSMVKVWRDEYEQGKMDNYFEKPTLLDVLKTRTASRRIGRAFDTMIRAVHEGMPAFNSRLKYPKTHFIEYKRRYGKEGVETALTSEVLVGYCMFTGINPIAMLHWLVYREAKSPAVWGAEASNSVHDIVVWKGAMAPSEYQRFHRAIHQLGLVSDQNRWAMDLLKVEYVYRNLPDKESIKDCPNINAASMQTLLDELPDFSKIEVGLGDVGYETVIEAAMAAGVNVFNANRDAFCLGLMSVGELKYHLNYGETNSKTKAEEELRDSFDTVEAFSNYMYEHICKVCAHSSGDKEDYMDLELGEADKVVISNSYQNDGLSVRSVSRSKAATTNFYKAVVDELKSRV